MEPTCEFCGVTDKQRCKTGEEARLCANAPKTALCAECLTPNGNHSRACSKSVGSRLLEAEEKAPEVTDDVVVKPPHYTQFAIEPVTFIMSNGLDFWRGNIIKYVCRAGSKLYEGMDAVESEITDLEKVRRYAEMRINLLRQKEIL